MKKLLGVVLVAGLGLSNTFAAGGLSSTSVLKTTTTWNGAPIQYASSGSPEVQAMLVDIAPGESTSWHKHPVNNYAYVLAGQLRVELEDKTSRVFKAGEAFAEVVNTWHRGINVGPGPVKLIVFYTGEAGVPITMARPSADAGHERH